MVEDEAVEDEAGLQMVRLRIPHTWSEHPEATGIVDSNAVG